MPSCPALFVAAPASGQGKTAVVAALARLHTRLGRRVQVFKCGPDFLDPKIHERASGRPCYNLDLGMCGREDAALRLFKAAKEADLILVEGVMGLFDGTPSGADIALEFNLPVLAVINARAMAQTFGAVAHGLATFRPSLPFYGVLANQVGTERHAKLLKECLPDQLHWYGHMPRNEAVSLPDRHLGLLQASEIADLDARLDAMADFLANTPAAQLPPPIEFKTTPQEETSRELSGITIAVAHDAAFGFIYPANLDTLRDLGAELAFFSPLAGDLLPPCQALWLPGGYPELHMETLSLHAKLWQEVRLHVAQGKPVLAECGGMMGLHQEIVGLGGEKAAMAGLLSGCVTMQPRLAALGTQRVCLPEGDILGHTFHYSRSNTETHVIAHGQTLDGRQGEPVYRTGSLTASYLHFYFPSAPSVIAKLFLGEE